MLSNLQWVVSHVPTTYIVISNSKEKETSQVINQLIETKQTFQNWDKELIATKTHVTKLQIDNKYLVAKSTNVDKTIEKAKIFP